MLPFSGFEAVKYLIRGRNIVQREAGLRKQSQIRSVCSIYVMPLRSSTDPRGWQVLRPSDLASRPESLEGIARKFIHSIRAPIKDGDGDDNHHDHDEHALDDVDVGGEAVVGVVLLGCDSFGGSGLQRREVRLDPF
jgi:hypothetical protein